MSEKPLIEKEIQAIRHIRNSLLHGRSPSVRDLQRSLGYRSPRSASDVLEKLIAKGFVRRRKNGDLQLLRDPEEHRSHARTVNVPLVGEVPCGQPLLAEENVEAYVPVATTLARPPHRYFILRARGNSMDRRGIQDGDLLLVRQQPVAENGEIVVALIDDEATVKEYRRTSRGVVLRQRSSEKHHMPIILTKNFEIQGVVAGPLPDLSE